MSIRKLGHPFEQHTADDEGDIDTNDAHEKFHAFLFVDSVEKTHCFEITFLLYSAIICLFNFYIYFGD